MSTINEFHVSEPISLFIFRRDLRLFDNTGLNEALNSGLPVAPCFIFDNRQTSAKNNEFFAKNAFQFLIESLEELNNKLISLNKKLFIFEGITEDIIERLIVASKGNIKRIYVNKDYTPFSIQRDAKLKEVTDKHSVTFNSYSDSLLFEPGQVVKDDGSPYTVYTPFMKKAFKCEFRKPTTKLNEDGFYNKNLLLSVNNEAIFKKLLPSRNQNLVSKGGRLLAIEILKRIANYKRYDDERNFPAIKGTTLLAPHNKFGTVSIREVHKEILKYHNSDHTLVKELIWRDFFTHIGYFFPHVYKGAFNKKYDSIKWHSLEEKETKANFEAFKTSRTGFPIIDAGVKELVETGFMHNRVRMIVGSFLVKDLHLDWHVGERFFAEHLTDYDPAVNNGNWQWVASTGCDAQPYFRVFNPWLQQQKFDPECIYIKKWLPELKNIEVKKLHKLNEFDFGKTDKSSGIVSTYPKPIVNHDIEKKVALELYNV